MREVRRQRWPAATVALIGALLIATVVLMAADGLSVRFEDRQMALLHLGASARILVLDGQWWRPLAAVLLPSSLMDALFGGFQLFWIGPTAERWLGSGRAVTIYLVGAVAGTLTGALIEQASAQAVATVGAYALFGALFVLRTHERGAVGEKRMRPWWWWVVAGFALTIHLLVPDVDVPTRVTGGLAGAIFVLLARRSRRSGSARGPLTMAEAGLGAGLAVAIALGVGFAVHAAATPDGARRDFLRAVEGLSKPTPLNNAAWRIALDADADADDLELAEAMSTRARTLAPTELSYKDTLATVWHRQGRHAEAARLQYEVVKQSADPLFASQLARFLRAHVQHTGVPLAAEGVPAGSVTLDRVGRAVILWWPKGPARLAFAELRHAGEILGTLLLVGSGTSGSERFLVPGHIVTDLDGGASLQVLWVDQADAWPAERLRFSPHDSRVDEYP